MVVLLRAASTSLLTLVTFSCYKRWRHTALRPHKYPTSRLIKGSLTGHIFSYCQISSARIIQRLSNKCSQGTKDKTRFKNSQNSSVTRNMQKITILSIIWRWEASTQPNTQFIRDKQIDRYNAEYEHLRSSLKKVSQAKQKAHYLTDELLLNYTVLRFARTDLVNEFEYTKVRHCDVKTKWNCGNLLQSEFWKETSHTGIFSRILCGDIWVEIITQERHVLFKHQCSMASLVLLSDLYIVSDGKHSPWSDFATGHAETTVCHGFQYGYSRTHYSTQFSQCINKKCINHWNYSCNYMYHLFKKKKKTLRTLFLPTRSN